MKYQITIITNEPFDTSQGKDEKEKPVKKEIESLGGKILDIQPLGQKKFSFPIKKETAGFYTTIHFEIEPTKVLELNKKLGLKQEILRHLILISKAAKIEAPKKPDLKPIKEITKPKPAEIEAPKIEKEKIEKPEPAKKPAPRPAKPQVSKTTQELEKETVSTEERLKALDKKLDELLKE